MDLSNAQEREALRNRVKEYSPEDSHLFDHLEDYVRLFPWPDFHTVYQGGLISIHAPNNSNIAAELKNMLELTSTLVNLEKFKGFNSLMEGFRNPTQFHATIFEVSVAAWCGSKRVCQSIEFSPEIEIGGHVKRPDFLWKTTLGNLYCECKRENSGDNKATKRVIKLSDIVKRAYEKSSPWDIETRVDVFVGHPAYDGTNEVLERVILRASKSYRAQGGETEFTEGVVKVKISKATDELPDFRGCVQIHHKEARANCTEPLLSTNARCTLTMSVMAHRLKRLVELVKDARTQLPNDQPGGIFIDIGISDIFVDKLHALMAQPAYANTPWISLWGSGRPLKAVFRVGQPFDNRLTE